MIIESAPAKNRKYYLSENFLGPGRTEGLLSAFSARVFGNMSLFYGNTDGALENRKDFLKELSVDYRDLICAKQVHGSLVRYAQWADIGRGALSYDNAICDTDAFITDKINLPLAIFTADCLSIFLYDPKAPAIGLIHAGWRSSKENIAAKTLQLMAEEFNTKAKDLYAAFGPAIRGCCYEVKREFINFFPADVIRKSSRYYLDLAKINKKQLLDSGLEGKNIFDPEICTFCQNGEFFSYRKEGSSCGRMMSVIMLK